MIGLINYALIAYSQENPSQELSADQIIERYINLNSQLNQNTENDIIQYGRLNMAITAQSSANRQINNTVYIDQFGNNNTAYAYQKGKSNQINLNQQGNNNYVSVDMVGENNLSDILQLGNSNNLIQEINGNNYNYNVQQLGNRNEIKMSESSNTSKSIKIIQKGNDMKLQISTRKIF